MCVLLSCISGWPFPRQRGVCARDAQSRDKWHQLLRERTQGQAGIGPLFQLESCWFVQTRVQRAGGQLLSVCLSVSLSPSFLSDFVHPASLIPRIPLPQEYPC